MSEQLKADEPTIDFALKNLMSILTAQSASSNRKSTTEDTVHFTTQSCLKCAQLVTKKLNSYSLPNVIEWGNLETQSKDQTAISRINQLTRYRVVTALRAQVLAKQGKICKLFGKLYLEWTHSWPHISREILVDNLLQESPLYDCLLVFLKTFGLSLQSKPCNYSIDTYSGSWL